MDYVLVVYFDGVMQPTIRTNGTITGCEVAYENVTFKTDNIAPVCAMILDPSGVIGTWDFQNEVWENAKNPGMAL
jgi:hypothetical protein